MSKIFQKEWVQVGNDDKSVKVSVDVQDEIKERKSTQMLGCWEERILFLF